MSGMRKWLCLLLGVAFAAFAAPSFAAKLFSVTAGGDGTHILVNVTNSPQSSGGQSVINSIQVIFPGNFPFALATDIPAITNTTNNTRLWVNGVQQSSLSYSQDGTGVNPVTLGFSYISNVSPGQTFTLAITTTANTCSGPQVSVTGAAWTGNTFGGTSFSVDPAGSASAILPCTGKLACDPTGTINNPQTFGNLDPLSTPLDTDLTGTPDFGLVRGWNRSGPVCGDPTPFTFQLDPAHQSASFLEDSLGQPTSVEYVIAWPPVSIDSDGWAGKQPCVSWGVTNPTWTPDPIYGCTGDFEPALFCLQSNVDGGDAVMPYIPNVAPYNLPATEPQYKYGNDPSTNDLRKAKVCVVQQGSTAINGQVQYWTNIIDQADSTVRFP